LKERICRRAADAFDPLTTRIVRRSARRSKTTHNRPVENYSFSGQIPLQTHRGDAVTRVAVSAQGRLAGRLAGKLCPSTIPRKGC